MKFKNFTHWVEENATNSNIPHADFIVCCKVIKFIKSLPFWQREKI